MQILGSSIDSMLSNADFISKLIEITPHIKVSINNKKERFVNAPAGFDIETTSFYNGDEKTAIMYEWTFGIGYIEDNDLKMLITYGRTWNQFITLIESISIIMDLVRTKTRLIVYVHNLPYEWQFMRKRFSWTKVFFMDDRKPVYAINDKNIEFRCSLKLSGKSLANTAKDLLKYKTEKMIGDLDYSIIRHSKTPLTPIELNYCRHDIEVILCYIQERIEQEGSIDMIPLTKTGYVRRYCKRAMFPEGKVLEDENPYDALDFEAVGISRDERMLSRRIYPRKCPPSGYDTPESWLIRLYQFVSGLHGRV